MKDGLTSQISLGLGLSMIVFMFLFQSVLNPAGIFDGIFATISGATSFVTSTVTTTASAAFTSISQKTTDAYHIVTDGVSFGVNSVKAAVTESSRRFNGFAAVLSSGNELEDEKIKAEIQGYFSDEVEVRPDQGGKTGVITPVFKKTNGENFVYVLVPVTSASGK